MTGIAWPIASTNGGPTYTPQMLRRLLGVFASKGTNRPLGATSGIHPATPANYITATSTTWTLAASLSGVIDAEASAAEGAYNFDFDTTSDTGSINAADATYQRVDSICVQISDPGAGDGTPSGAVTLVYTAGIPGVAGGARGAAGGPPNVPARAFEIVQITVPQAGGGGPSVKDVAPRMAGAGGIVVLPSGTAYPPNPHVGQYADHGDLGALERYNGTGWEPAAGPRTIGLQGTPAYGALPAAAALRMQAGRTSLTTDANGRVHLVFPVGFSSGLLFAMAQQGDVTNLKVAFIFDDAAGANWSSCYFRAVDTTSGLSLGTGISLWLNWVAYGF